MKKYCFLVVAFIAGNLSARAQVEIGLKAGMNVNTVKYRKAEPNTASIGFNVGVLTQITVNKSFFIQPELLYSVKGYRSTLVGYNGYTTSRLNYINLPILAGFPISQQLAFLIGPEFGYMVKAAYKEGGATLNATDLYQRFDWGLDLGATYKFTPALGVEVRYNYGFRGIVRGITTDDNGVPNGSNKDGANRVFQAGLFYLL
jgi:hypothetical protein